MGKLQPTLGHKIRSLREGHRPKLSREAFAEVLGVTGTTVYRWENAINWPEPDMLESIAEFFKIPVGDLMSLETKEGRASSKDSLIVKALSMIQDATVEDIERVLHLLEVSAQTRVKDKAKAKA